MTNYDDIYLYAKSVIPKDAPPPIRAQLEAFLMAAAAMGCTLCGRKDDAGWEQWLCVVEEGDEDKASISGVCGRCRTQFEGMSQREIIDGIRAQRRA